MIADQTTEPLILDGALWVIASCLDHPSVYMGGPSQRSVERARRIVQALQAEGFQIMREAGK
jgi:hypothetical protein